MDFDKKYAPKSFDELIINNPLDRKRLEQYAFAKRRGNLLLHGPKGTAKSTTARLICENINRLSKIEDDVEIYRASDVNEGVFNAFSNIFSWQRLQLSIAPYIVIEEADEMSRVTQKKLRGYMDSMPIGNFIMTTNNINQLDAPLVDRCDVIEMRFLSIDEVLPKATQIIAAEGKHITERDLRTLLEAGDGSIRRMLRNVHDYVLM